MSETNPSSETTDDVAALQGRLETLEHELQEARRSADARLVIAEMKAEALRAGMVDLDGLKLLDMSSLVLTTDGHVAEAAQILAQFRRAKPWLFGGASSSSVRQAPPAQPPRQKMATDMTDAEYQAARLAILKQRG